MASALADRAWIADGTSLIAVRVGDSHHDPFLSRLSERSPAGRVETGGPTDLRRLLGDCTPSGIVCVAPSASRTESAAERQGTTADATTATDDFDAETATFTSALNEIDPDCPVIVVGATDRAAEFYDAGATDVVPLDPRSDTGAAVEQVASILDRHHGRLVATEVFDGSGEGITVHDPETGEIRTANDQFCRILGYEPGTQITLDDITGHDDEFTRERAVSLVREAADGNPSTFVWRNPGADDEDVWVEVSLERAQIAGVPSVVASITDVTEREAKQSELEETRERVEQMFARISDGFFAVDDDWRVSYVNEGGAGVLNGAMGRDDDPEDLIGLHLWEEIPEARDTEFYEQYHEAMRTQEPVSFEQEYAPMGVWFNVRAYPDEDGLSVYFQDVTEKKEDERELRIKERVMEKASLSISVTDPSEPDNPLSYVNEAFEELTGYDREDVLGENCRFLQGPDTDEARVDRLRSAIEAEEPVRLEMRNYRQDGSEFWNQMEVSPIYDEDGSLLRYLGTQTDITEKRRVREVRRQLLATTRELLSVESQDEIARIVSDAAASVLGQDFNVVYLRERDSDRLVPSAWSDRVSEVIGDPPTATRDGLAEAAIDEGEPQIYDDLQAVTNHPPEEVGPVESAVTLPLGDHGVLLLGETQPGAFDDDDVELGELLTVNATVALDRTDRLQELREYETLFETVQDKLYALDADGYFQMVSEPLATALGYERSELEGRHATTVADEATLAAGRDTISNQLDDTDGTRPLRENVEGDELDGDAYEGTLTTKDGTELPVEIELSLLPADHDYGGSVGVVRDISQRRRREQELGVFREAITEAGIGVGMYDDTGQFTYVNDHYGSLLGESRDAAESAVVSELFEHVDGDAFDSFWDSFAPGEARRTETELNRTDGTTIPVEVSTTAVQIDGERSHIQTVREITGRRERRQQADALHRIIRHNLRNDLTVVLGHANVLADELDGEHARWAEMIGDTAADLVDLSKTVQDAERIIDRETVRKPVEVVEMLEDEITELQSEHEVTVERDLPARQYVSADSTLSVAVEHLLENAVEHNDSESPTVEVRAAPVEDRTGWVAFEIEDDGPGIPEYELDVLTAGEETPLNHGSGMGLWVVYWIVSRYGGELDFEATEEGTVVRIALPAPDPLSGSEVPGP